MMKRMMLMLLAFLIVVGIIGFFKYEGFKGFMAMKDGMAHQKQTISSAKATLEDWSSQMEAVGSLRAAKGVDISNELAGIVDTINFNSGDDVKEGALLIKLRAEDDVAKLASSEAAQRIAEINFSRDKKQLAVQAVAQATVDADSATLASARAQYAEQKAVVDKKFIRAPFSGRLGIRNVDLGQYLTPGTAIVTLQQLDPVYLDFNLPQQALSQISVGQKITAKSDTYPGRKFEGAITAINPKVDVNTRNLQVRAELANSDRALLPGMYATADITLGQAKKFVTLPQTAITYNPYGDTVFVIKQNDKNTDKDSKPEDNLVVEQDFVTIGETRGDEVQILKGLKEGDTVVGSGQLKLQNGSAVTVDNSVTPKDDSNPQPKDQ